MSTKGLVLERLSRGGEVSGEELASLCGVSRTAVWKAVSALRGEGFSIDAATNRGYVLRSSPDRLDADEIRAEMARLGAEAGEIHVFGEIDSTSNEAKRRAAGVGAFRSADGSLTEGGRRLQNALFTADRQTAGRGRLGRTFESPKGAGAYLSLVHAPEGGVRDPALLTAAAAVAAARALDSLFGTEARIKWVNDVFLPVGGVPRKAVGILAEGVANFETGAVEAAVVGIGVNLRKAAFPPELAETATSVEESLGRPPEAGRNALIARIAANLVRIYGSREDVMDEYRSRSLLTGRTVRVNPLALGTTDGGSFSATVEGITDAAELAVRTEDGRRLLLRSGEVTLHKTT